LMLLRGTPTCATLSPGTAEEPTELARATRGLEACSVPVGEVAAAGDAPVMGKTALALIDRIDAMAPSPEHRQPRNR
jgi:hypothetical protein